MKPIKHTSGTGRIEVVIGSEFSRYGIAQLLMLQNVDCTIEGGQFDLRAARVERAEQGFAESRNKMRRMSGGHQRCFVVDLALQRRSAQVERIARRETDFDHSAVVLQTVSSVGKKVAGKKNVAARGLCADVIAAQVNQPEIAAEG